MANTTFCELREKEIINICDGARLGCIYIRYRNLKNYIHTALMFNCGSRTVTFLGAFAQFGRTCYPVLQNSKNRR